MLSSSAFSRVTFVKIATAITSSFSFIAPAVAAELRTAYANINNIEIDRYDALGSLKDGFYLDVGGSFRSPIGFKGFAFDTSGALHTAYQNINNIEIDRYDASGALQTGVYLDVGGSLRSPIGFKDFAFDASNRCCQSNANSSPDDAIRSLKLMA